MHYRENMKPFAIAIATALGFMLDTAPIANAKNAFQCNGLDISDGRTINGDLIVPAGAGCTLRSVTVLGNVRVAKRATLLVEADSKPVTIGGNIVTNQCNAVLLATIDGSISVEGNVTIQKCRGESGYVGPSVTIGGNFVCSDNASLCRAYGGVVQGNLIVHNNNSAQAPFVTSNTVSGNVDFSGNSGNFGTPEVAANTIGGNLLCFKNSTPPVAGFAPNTVAGNKLGQCAGL